MTERLVHYSREPLERIVSVAQIEQPHFKPRGLWISVDGNDDGWREWCDNEGFQLDSLKFVHDIRLAKSANVLRITNADGIDRFDDAYSASLNPEISFRSIDWKKVAGEYQGIIIAPYIWQKRLSDNAQWYYAWDCASGCIWDAAAIESFNLRESP